jgi:hypothetical protein
MMIRLQPWTQNVVTARRKTIQPKIAERGNAMLKPRKKVALKGTKGTRKRVIKKSEKRIVHCLYQK